MFLRSLLSAALLAALMSVGCAGGGGPVAGVGGRPGAVGEGPLVRYIELPEFPGMFAIWGATGRDRRGHIWFAVCGHSLDNPTAHLYELVPSTGRIIDRGDVLSALKSCGVYRPGELQMKIHSRIYQADDGHIYFSSMDENGEQLQTGRLPTWDSHLWRLRLPEGRWEHLMATREALIAAGGFGRYIYALGYLGHKLYQYDRKTGRSRMVEVGSLNGHVSRNFLIDRRGHIYVPRVTGGQRRWSWKAELVELDSNLQELAATPLKRYFGWSLMGTHGITAFQPLKDGSIAFVTHPGRLFLVVPPAPPDEGPAQVVDLGWFHPDGRSYTASLFADEAGPCLLGVSRRRGGYDWVTYDLQARTARTEPFRISEPQPLSLAGTQLYGSITRDDLGNFYVAGARHRGDPDAEVKLEPVLLQVRTR